MPWWLLWSMSWGWRPEVETTMGRRVGEDTRSGERSWSWVGGRRGWEGEKRGEETGSRPWEAIEYCRGWGWPSTWGGRSQAGGGRRNAGGGGS